MDSKYKHILPKHNPPQGEDGTPAKQSEPAKRRRSSTIIACNGCRAKKTGCDGNRPTCTACLRRGILCVYISASPSETPSMAMKREIEELKKENIKLQELFDMLGTLPEFMALDMLQKLRLTTTDISSLPSDGSSSLDEASPRRHPVRLPAHGSIEFRLMLRHGFAYPTLAPLDAFALGPPSILVTDDILSAATTLLTRKTPPPTTYSSLRMPGSDPRTEQMPSVNIQAYYDTRLELLDISFWSCVQISNQLAATIISVYLETDHPTLGLFNDNLFITDLVENRIRYCSQLLVSSVLAWACQALSSFDPETVSIGDAFFGEANMLWQLETSSDSLPTVAAAQLLSLRSIYSGNGSGQSYLKSGIAMAQRMGLFGLAEYAPTSNPSDTPDIWEIAQSQTAWGAFNLTAMCSFMFQESEPALLFPPKVGTPPGGNAHQQSNEASTDNLARTSGAATGRSLDKTFPAMCEFWALTSKWTAVYYLQGTPPVQDRVSIEYANRAFLELLAWSDRLHVMLARGEQSSHHSMWFHASIVQIYRPFTETLSPTLQLSTKDEYTAKAISTASLNQLRHLAIVFRHTFTCASYSVLWHIALLHVANGALQDTADPQWRSYFMLSLNSYADLFASFRVSGSIIKSLLLMALRLGVIKRSDALTFMKKTRARAVHQSTLEQINASFVIDMNLAVVDRQAAQLDILSNSFDDMTLLGESIASGSGK